MVKLEEKITENGEFELDTFNPINHIKKGYLTSKDLIALTSFIGTIGLFGVGYLGSKGYDAYNLLMSQPYLIVKEAVDENSNKVFLMVKDRETRERYFIELKTEIPLELQHKKK